MTRDELFDWVRGEYGAEPEHLWRKYPRFAVLRHGGKWFGVVMDVPRSKFGLGGDDLVDVLNVKADRASIDVLIELPGMYRAYHMNKLHWLSIFLDGSVPDARVQSLLADSYAFTLPKRRARR